MKVTYIKRLIDNDLKVWANALKHKPLLLRGARQVGKSSSIRHLAEQFENFLEINFEKTESLSAKQIFERTSNPKQICSELSLIYKKNIVAGKTLLFFDEIQACPNAISALRFFYEDYPEQHIVAAGSLLEFALANLKSFGVGRITNLFMYPFSFSEFLDACGATLLNETIQKANPNNPLPDYFHDMAVEYFRKFLIIGGMPEAVAKYVQTGGNIYEAVNVLDDLLTTLKSDFSKYLERVPQLRINAVFDALVTQMGNKFVYSKVADDYHLSQIKECVDLLVMAGLVVPVVHTAANGVPLGAEINPKKQKFLLLDTGLYQNLAALNVSEIMLGKDFSFINKGKIAELFAGLEIMKAGKNNAFQQLYFWQREAKSSNAEVDYIIQKGETIVPIEIKSGTKGSMQSLHLFLKEKQTKRGVRCSLENFAHYDNIDVYPLYAINQVKS